MKVTCESCYFGFDIDDSKIPPSGAQATCPVCMQQFKVHKGGATTTAPAPTAPAKKPEALELSSMDVDFGSVAAPSMAPQPPSGPPPAVAPISSLELATTDGVDLDSEDGGGWDAPAPEETPLPAAKAPVPSRFAPPPRPASPPPTKSAAPPPPAPKPPIADELPAPKAAVPSRFAPPPPTKAPPPKAPTVDELPAPKAPVPSRFEAPLAPPPTAESLGLSEEEEFGIGLDAPDADDLPAPVDPNRREVIELPAAAAPKPLRPPLAKSAAPVDTGPELPTPRAAGVDLPAPKAAGIDLPTPKAAGVDLPTPKAAGVADLPTPLGLETDSLTPKLNTDLPVAKEQETGVTAREIDGLRPAPARGPTGAAAAEPAAEPAGAAAAAPPSDGAAAAPSKVAPGPRRPSKRRVALLAGGVSAVLLLGGGGYVVFATDAGKQLLGSGGGDQQAVVTVARKHLSEDTLPSFRKATSALRLHMEQHGETRELLGLEAQAHLSAARLGIAAEAKAAEAVFAKLDAKADAKHEEPLEARHARALHKIVQKQPAEAQQLLSQILGAAPSDATALVYQGWLELAAGDAAAASTTLKKAIAAEATRPSALYAYGRARELLGDTAAASEHYRKTLARSPQHFRAALGLLRVGAPDLGRTSYTAIEEFIQKRLDGTGPRELAEAWATAGLMAREDGRRDVAEDRLRKAVGLDPEAASAQRELARTLLQQRRAKDAIGPAKKALELEPKSRDAKLLVLGSYTESGQMAEAKQALQALLPDGAKLPLVQYYQARLALQGDRPQPTQAIELLTLAIAGDPKLLDASLWKSQTLQKLGRTEDAVATLKAAESAAASDLPLTLDLGDAYAELKRPLDAESRYRAVLDKAPNDVRGRMGLALALEMQGKLDAARVELDKLVQLGQRIPGLNERLGHIAHLQGKLDESTGFFDAALQEGVPTTTLRLEAAEVALLVKNLDRAFTLADSVAKEEDRGPRAHLLLARVFLERGKLDDAMISARRAAMYGDLPESHFVLGQTLEQMGKLDQAVTEFSLARRPPIEQEAALGRARIMARLGATRDAIDELLPLTKVPRLRAPALGILGDCYADQQQRDKARKAYEEATQADRNASDLAFKFGRALIDAGKRPQAIDELNRALKLGGDKASFAAEAYLLLGDAQREQKANAAALAAYQRYLQIAPTSSPSRIEVQRTVKLLGGSP